MQKVFDLRMWQKRLITIVAVLAGVIVLLCLSCELFDLSYKIALGIGISIGVLDVVLLTCYERVNSKINDSIRKILTEKVNRYFESKNSNLRVKEVKLVEEEFRNTYYVVLTDVVESTDPELVEELNQLKISIKWSLDKIVAIYISDLWV